MAQPIQRVIGGGLFPALLGEAEDPLANSEDFDLDSQLDLLGRCIYEAQQRHIEALTEATKSAISSIEKVQRCFIEAINENRRLRQERITMQSKEKEAATARQREIQQLDFRISTLMSNIEQSERDLTNVLWNPKKAEVRKYLQEIMVAQIDFNNHRHSGPDTSLPNFLSNDSAVAGVPHSIRFRRLAKVERGDYEC